MTTTLLIEILKIKMDSFFIVTGIIIYYLQNVGLRPTFFQPLGAGSVYIYVIYGQMDT